jgi:glycosyltransferase involved in cell wall biosynthesis
MVFRNKDNKSVLLIGSFLSSQVGTRSVGEELGLRLDKKDWQVILASSYRLRFLRLLDMLTTICLAQSKYRVVYLEVYSGAAFLWADWSSRLLQILKKPYVLVLHGGGLVEFSQRYPRRVSRLLHSTRCVVTPSLFLKHELYAIKKDIQYLPNGLDLSGYEHVHRHQVRPKLVWLRALHEIYQPEMAVRVLALLKQDYPSVQLLMIGPDKNDGSREKMERAAARLGVTDALNWIGPVPKSEVPQVLNQGDIFLNTTRYESFGVSVMEAAASGLPIVTTNAGELSYLWQNNHDALVVDVDDAPAMADSIRRLLTEPELAGRLSHNARRKAEGFDWSEILPQWEKLFAELAHNA